MGICSGGIPGAQLPEINIDNEQLSDLINTAIEDIQEKVQENCTNFPIEIANCDPKPYKVPDTTIELNKDTPDEEIAMSAIIAAFATQTRDSIKVYTMITYIILDIYYTMNMYITNREQFGNRLNHKLMNN